MNAELQKSQPSNGHRPDLLDLIEGAFANSKSSFPRNGQIDYGSVLRGWISQIEANVLPHTTAGAVSVDGGRLTAHDVEHVRRVRAVCSDLVHQAATALEPYELVFLLYAVYIHDLGNSLGRDGHERRANDVLDAAQLPMTMDQVENRQARDIARAHGGRASGSKDTIGQLPVQQTIWNFTVRTRLIAAILRLADELADDPARADRVAMRAGTLPREAEVYHHYAAALHSQVAVAAQRTIELHFEIYDETLFTRPLGKGPGETQFLDEIFERTLKTYREARYCSRHLRPLLDFDRVRVTISIFDRDNELAQPISYTIGEHGYGDEVRTIYDLSPELANFEGSRLTAERLAVLLRPADAANSREPT